MGEKNMMEFVWMFCAGVIAFGKGRGIIRWIVAAYIFSFFAPAVLAFLPKKVDKFIERETKINDWAEGVVIKKEVQDINTVDDLFKQLETPKG
jgi:hypothetical protein